MNEREKLLVRQLISCQTTLMTAITTIDKERGKAAAALGAMTEIIRKNVDRLKEDPDFKADFDELLQHEHAEFIKHMVGDNKTDNTYVG